jgi:hypothetical protein
MDVWRESRAQGRLRCLLQLVILLSGDLDVRLSGGLHVWLSGLHLTRLATDIRWQMQEMRITLLHKARLLLHQRLRLLLLHPGRRPELLGAFVALRKGILQHWAILLRM